MSETVWITLIVVVGVVVIVALWLGRRLRLSRDADGGVSIEADEAGGAESAQPGIKVGEDIEISGGEAGDIAGYKVSAGTESATETGSIEVARGAKIRNKARIGDIVGVKIDGNKNKD